MDTDESKDTQQDPDLSQGGSETDTSQEGGDDIEALKKELEETKAKNVKLYNRLQGNKGKAHEPETQKVVNSSSEISREEVKLFAKGYTDEEVDFLNDLRFLAERKGKTISFTEALADEKFVLYKAEKERKERSQKAQLGAGRGSTSAPTGFKSGMTKAEHMKLWEEQQK